MEANVQPREPRIWRKDGSLEIVKVWPTLQGEGPYAGLPAVFVRLAGCNLDCDYCDTDYTSNRVTITSSEVAQLVCQTRRDGLVVLTGGEPLRQNVGSIVRLLLAQGYIVQIETNGTLPLPEGLTAKDVSVICSPKALINPAIEPEVQCFKYVLQHGAVDPKDGLPTYAMGHLGRSIGRPSELWRGKPCHIYVQPLDQGNEIANALNIQVCVKSCLQFGYRLSLQLHKIVGVE